MSRAPSPFDGLRMPRELACEFFAVFSRFEFALKECGFLYVTQDGRAAPSWRDYRAHAVEVVNVLDRSELADAVAYLNAEPPQVQVGPQRWSEDYPLRGIEPIGTALDAAQRVRNNLFHGGKYSPHSPDGRDERLVRAALCLLYACLDNDGRLREAYEQPTTY